MGGKGRICARSAASRWPMVCCRPLPLLMIRLAFLSQIGVQLLPILKLGAPTSQLRRVVLHAAFLPSRCLIAEVGLHTGNGCGSWRISPAPGDYTLLEFPAPQSSCCYTTFPSASLEKFECGRLRFKQHLLRLSRIRLHQPRTRIGHNLWVFDPTSLPYAHEITALLIRGAFFQRLFMPLGGSVGRSHPCFQFGHSTCSSPARLGAGEEQVEATCA